MKGGAAMRSLILALGLVAPLTWAVLQEKWDPRWVDYVCRGGLFSAECPETMRSDRASLRCPDMGRVDLVSFRAEDDARRYVVAYGDFPATVNSRSNDGALDFLSSNLLF